MLYLYYIAVSDSVCVCIRKLLCKRWTDFLHILGKYAPDLGSCPYLVFLDLECKVKVTVKVKLANSATAGPI